MALKNMSLLSQGSINATGGTALVFADDGITVQNGVHLVVPADADYQTRRQLTAKYRPPTLDAKTGVYSKDKKSMVYVQPLTLANGTVVFNTLRIEREVHPATTVSDRDNLNIIGAQLLCDSDAGGFWATGSVS